MQGHDFVMLVNLSLERSANIKIGTVKPSKAKQVFSAENGRVIAPGRGEWALAVGQGTGCWSSSNSR